MAQGTKGTGNRPPLSFAEAAPLLGVNRATVYRRVRRGELAAVKVKGQMKIQRIEIDLYLAREAEALQRYAS